MRILPLFLLFIYYSATNAYVTREVKAKKGKFFLYTLHSATLFNQTVPVKWSATLKGRPALPQWLHLMPSRHLPLGYLLGTPVTAARQVTVHLIAKRMDTFKSEHHYIIITLDEDPRFTKSTTQLFDLSIRNMDAEDIINDRTGLIGRLEQSISDTFKGRLVNPYIFNIRSEFAPELRQNSLRYEKFGSPSNKSRLGSIISVGTQRGFYPNVYSLVRNLRTNPNYCKKANQVVVNRFFAPTFQIDWCKTVLRNITLLHEFAESETESERMAVDPINLEAVNNQPPPPPPEYYSDKGGWWYFGHIFPALGGAVVIVILILTYIFFGKRTGQNHRDRNTTQEQMEEFISVRQSQRHLRELSVQRQLLLMANERDNSAVPSGVHSFLQPKSRAPTSISGSTKFSKSASRLNDPHVSGEDVTSAGESVPVGKQTVAEAAKQCGSSLHLYRNPLDSDSEKDNETDSLEEKPIY